MSTAWNKSFMHTFLITCMFLWTDHTCALRVDRRTVLLNCAYPCMYAIFNLHVVLQSMHNTLIKLFYASISYIFFFFLLVQLSTRCFLQTCRKPFKHNSGINIYRWVVFEAHFFTYITLPICKLLLLKFSLVAISDKATEESHAEFSTCIHPDIRGEWLQSGSTTQIHLTCDQFLWGVFFLYYNFLAKTKWTVHNTGFIQRTPQEVSVLRTEALHLFQRFFWKSVNKVDSSFQFLRLALVSLYEISQPWSLKTSLHAHALIATRLSRAAPVNQIRNVSFLAWKWINTEGKDALSRSPCVCPPPPFY